MNTLHEPTDLKPGLWSALILMVALLLSVNCNGVAVDTPTPSSNSSVPHETITPARPSASAASVVVTIEPTATSTASPTATPTLLPTATVPASVRVAAPSDWQDRLSRAVATLARSETQRKWQLVSEGEPAELRITQTESPLLAGNVPLVVAVPFVAEWEETSLEAARAIQSDGHDFAQILAWPQLTPELKALRIDGRLPYEPDYPLIQPYYIEATTGFEGAGQTLAKALLATEEESEPVLLAAVGDLMLDRALGAAIMRGRPEFPFELVSPELTVPDITVGNLESALGDLGSGADKRYTFQAPPRAAYSLAAAGFDVLSLANNHAMDFGPEALLQGIRLLREQGIHAVGAGATSAAARTPAIVQANGLRLAFLAYVNVPVERSGFDTASWQATVDTPGLAWGDPETIAVDVGAARSQADLVIVLLHSGYEYIEEPSEAQRAAAHAAIDAGAHLVLGHHAHLLQGVEFRKQGVIAYGLGNFAFEIEGDPASAILRVWLDGRGVRHLELVPAIVQFGGQPRLAESWEAAPIRRQVYFLTRLLNAR